MPDPARPTTQPLLADHDSLDAAARLLLACTAPTPALAALPTRGVDWGRFRMLAVRHAATPLVHRSLEAAPEAGVPAALRADLRRQAQVNSLRNRLLLDELARITAAAQAAGLVLVPYKGPVLAQQLHGDAGMRVCSDLDLLTDLATMDHAAALLQALGYAFMPLRGQQAGRPSAHNLRHWHCYNLVRPAPLLALDLHGRFAPRHFPVAADLSTFAARLVPCTVQGHAFQGFADADLLVLLAMHAAKDGMWRRLTWFSELAVLVHRLPPSGLADATATAARLGCLRLLQLALLVVQRLYGLPAGCAWPGSAAALVRLDPLADATLRGLFGPAPVEPSRLQWHFQVHPRLRERRRDRWACRVAGLHALLDLLRPPPSQLAQPWPSALLRYPAYWLRGTGRRLRGLVRVRS